MSLSPGSARTVWACTLMVASGFAGLAYQIVWTQQSALWLGHESAAVLAVVAAFFGGLACGSIAAGELMGRSSRLWPSAGSAGSLRSTGAAANPARPVRWYAGCEIVIAIWGLVLALLLEPVSNGLLTLIGPQPSPVWHWSVAFCGTFLVMAPATMAMGATLPVMERVLATYSAGATSEHDAPARAAQSAISVLYAANTLGAVLGVLGAAFWLVPQIGLTRTTAVCAVLNVACAIVALRLARRDARSELTAPAKDSAAVSHLALLAATGLLGIGYEVLVVRALSQVAENTVYTFAILLAVYLVCTAGGAGVYARWFAGRYDSTQLRDRLLQLLAGSCLLGTLLLSGAESIKAALLEFFESNMPTALAGETLLAAMAFLLPTLLMGALFSHLSTNAKAAGIPLGRAIGVNMLGSALAPLLFTVLLVPLLGLKLVLLAVAAGYIALTSPRGLLKPAPLGLVAATLACVAWAPSLQIVTVPEGGRLLAHEEGVMGSVSVVEDAHGYTTLHIDNRQQEGSSATLFADARQALLPVLLHPAPHRALFLGVGTGLTSSSATLDPSLQVDAVELVPEVIAASAHFADSLPDTADRSRLNLMSADARRYVRTSVHTYDVIVSDNFHPARSGSGSLYTIEHFRAVRIRLNEGGVFCQWLPLHQLDLDTLRSIVRSFIEVYPKGVALLATNSLDTPAVGLLSRRDGEPFHLRQVRDRLSSVPSASLQDFGVADDLALLGNFVAGPAALARFAGNAPINTDDRPIVAYRAPHITYAPNSQPRDRLITLLSELEIQPSDLLTSRSETAFDAAWTARLAAYWSARNQFIEAGRNVRPLANVHAMLAQVREPLLNVLHVSPDFRPAYDPLLQMATALGQVDRPAARTLLQELELAQPSRPEAARALRELSP